MRHALVGVSGASYADTHPVADDATPDGRKAIRRIVVVPNLSQVPGFEALRDLAE
jgi:hypothetical protein